MLIVFRSGIVLIEAAVEIVFGVGAVGIPVVDAGKGQVAVRFQVLGERYVFVPNGVLLAHQRQVVS